MRAERASRVTAGVLLLSGDLDLATRPAVEHPLGQHSRTSRSSVVVDLSAVAFMDTSGMDSLLHAHVTLAAVDRLLVGTLRAKSEPDDGESTHRADLNPGAAELVFEATQWRAARQHREILEQAKGLLMGRHHCGADQAAALLELVAGRRHVEVQRVAAALVALVGSRRGVGLSPSDPVVDAAVKAALGSRGHGER